MGIIPIWAFTIFLIRDIITTVMRVMSDNKKHDMVTSKNAKVKTLVQMGYVVFILFLIAESIGVDNPETAELYKQALYSNEVLYVLYIVLAYTLITLIDYLIVNKSIFIRNRTVNQ
ncbi:MAG: hypothetical protein Kapaf2KO_22110 [Candidatus Kapaibacteriales bacterium]